MRGQEVLQKLHLMLSKFIKKYNMSCSVCRGKIGQRQQKPGIQWDKIIRKLIKQCLTGNTGSLSSAPHRGHSNLGNNTYSSLGWTRIRERKKCSSGLFVEKSSRYEILCSILSPAPPWKINKSSYQRVPMLPFVSNNSQ